MTILTAGSVVAAPSAVRLRSEAEVEYYLPTKEGRAIHTVFVNGLFVGVELRRILTIDVGMTATAATGTIVQDGVVLDSNAGGVGPIVLVRCQPFHAGRFSLSLDILGGLVAYSSRFPAGGDLYDFTWRLGGAAIVRLDARWSLTVGVRWMHVSNGQGLTPRNPSYEGVGLGVGFVHHW